MSTENIEGRVDVDPINIALPESPSPSPAVPSTCRSEAETAEAPLPAATSSYFSSFADDGFTPDYSLSFAEDFKRLIEHQGWQDEENHERRRRQLCLAAENELEMRYGSNKILASWQALCLELGKKPAPATITACKEALVGTYVCINDFVELRRTALRQQRPDIDIDTVNSPGFRFITTETMLRFSALATSEVQTFESEALLSKYCRTTRKIFPREAAKAEGFIGALLRHILNPRRNRDVR